MDRAAIERELEEVRDAINALYWTFTRTARGKPPCLVRPELYARAKVLAAQLREHVVVEGKKRNVAKKDTKPAKKAVPKKVAKKPAKAPAKKAATPTKATADEEE